MLRSLFFQVGLLLFVCQYMSAGMTMVFNNTADKPCEIKYKKYIDYTT